MPEPLEGVRVLAIEQYGAGPFGSLQLADMGADVIKIEDPSSGGDVARYVPPFSVGEDSLFFETFNRNKRSISLDLRHPDGRRTFEHLVFKADAVYSNLRGDVPAQLRIRYADLKHINPRIVCCSLSGFGMEGPRASAPGYDYVLQGLAGWMSLTGEPDGPPGRSGLSLVDFSGGLVAATSVLSGVIAARRDGVGMDCDLSLYDTAVSMLTYLATWHLSAGYEPTRTSRSAHPSLVPFQVFAAKDGWLVIGCAKEKFWKRLADVVGHPELAADPRFESFEMRLQHREELQRTLDELLSNRRVADWLVTMRGASIPCAPVHSVAEALADEHTLARGLIVSVDHPVLGRVREVASASTAGPRRTTHFRAPRRGEHTSEVLKQILGWEQSTIDRLRNSGAFGAQHHVEQAVGNAGQDASSRDAQ